MTTELRTLNLLRIRTQAEFGGTKAQKKLYGTRFKSYKFVRSDSVVFCG